MVYPLPKVRPSAREPAPELSVSRDPSTLWLILLGTLATALRVFRLGAKSLWLDEAESLILAQANWHVFLSSLVHRQANMALYYFVLRAWVHLGVGSVAARSLSVVAGVAAIPAIYFLGEKLFGARTARLAALLLCFHVFHIRYSQEARSYSLLVLLAILSTLALVRAVRDSSRAAWLGYALISVLMVYAHVFGCWVLLAQWISLFWLVGRIDVKKVVGSVLLINMLLSPLAFCLLVVSDRSQLSWLVKPSLSDFYRFSLDMTGNGGALILLFCVLMILIAVGLPRKPPPSGANLLDCWKYPLLLSWLLLPPAALLLVSIRWPVFSPRFLIPCVPPLVLLVADGITRIRPKLLGTAAVLLLLAFWLNAAFSYYRTRVDVDHSDNWQAATWYVLTHAEPGDAVLFTFSEERLAFDEYQRQFHMANVDIQQFPEGSDFDFLTRRPVRPDDEMLERVANSHRRVWVVSAFQPDPVSRRAAALLGKRFHEHVARNFGFLRLDLFSEPASSAASTTGSSTSSR